MAGGSACCKLSWLAVKGFKSLRDVVLRVPGGFTVLVGPNGSGKSALVESLLLLRDIMWYLEGRVANPFQRWWGYGNVVWRGDESRVVELGVGLDCSGCRAEELTEKLGRLGVEASTWAAGFAASELEYRVTLSGAGGGFRIVRERLCIRGFGCATLEGGRLTLSAEGKALKDLAGDAARLLEFVVVPFRKLVEAAKLLEVLEACTASVGDIVKATGREVVNLAVSLFEKGVDVGPTGLRSLIELYVERGRYPTLLAGAGALLTGELDRLANVLVNSSGRFREAVSRYLSCVAERSGLRIDVSEVANRVVEDAARTLVKLLASYVTAVFYIAALEAGMFIDGIRVIRMLDYRAMQQPRPLEPGEALLEDGSNLTSVLFNLGRGRLPDEVAAIVAAVLGASDVSGFFEATADGRLVLRLVVDGLSLAPPSVPEGAWKAMALMAAALSGATVLAVDEFENSLHAAAQELLLEELRRSVPTVIVATHSPIVVDTARNLDEIAVVELEAGETRIKRIADPRGLAEKLRRLGLAPSEALLYGLLETAEERGSSGP